MGVWASSLASGGNGHDRAEEEKAERLAIAKRILKAARRADLSPEAYFEGRGIKEAPENAFLLPAKEAERLKLPRPSFPRIVLPVVNTAGKETGCHTICLAKDGTRKPRVKGPVKFSHGTLRGGFVQLGEPDRTKPLIVAEGIETALSAAQLTGLPAIATCGTAGYASVKFPECMEAIICADNHEHGIKAAQALAQRLTIPARIAIPKGPDKGDWNDALQEEGASPKALKKAILDAPLYERSTERKLTTRPLSDFEEREFEWLWERFIPMGMVTSVFGDGGVGKSTVTYDIAAHVTKNRPLPFVERPVSGSVLIMTKEDAVETIIKPRLRVAGADLNRVHMVGYTVPDNPEEFDLVDRLDTSLAELEEQIVKLGDVRLLIVDPAADFAGNLDLYRDADVRKLLEPLVRLARRHNLAVIVIVHINKNQEQAAKHRAMGSLAFRNVPRSALLIASDATDLDRRIMVQTKSNLTRGDSLALGFTIKQARDGKYTRIVWEDEFSDADPDELLSKKKAKLSKQDQAAQLLRRWLADGPRPVKDLQDQAENHHIGWDTMKLAKKSVCVRSEKGKEGWWWSLPTEKTSNW